MLKESLNKNLSPKLAAIVIILVGLGSLGYLVAQIDFEKFELSVLTIGLPLLFLLVVFLFAYLVLHPKKYQITSNETDKKIKKNIDTFNHKTAKIQNTISVISVILIALILFVFFCMPEQLVIWLSV